MAKDSMVFYRSVSEALEELNGEDYKIVMKAIFAYAYDGIVPEFESSVCRMAWKFTKPQVDACVRKFEAQVENGRKGGLAKASKTVAKVSQGVAKVSQSVADQKPVVTLNEKCEMRNEKCSPIHTSSSCACAREEDDDDDDLIMTTSGTMIRKGNIHFGKTVKLGTKRIESFDSQKDLSEIPDNRQPITQEEKDRILKRLEDFKKRHAQAGRG